jgi:hypothetical protein
VESRKIRFYPHAGPGLGQGQYIGLLGWSFFFCNVSAAHRALCSSAHIKSGPSIFRSKAESPPPHHITSPHLTATHHQSHCRPPRPPLQPPVLIRPQPLTLTLTSSDAAVIDVNVPPGVATTTPESDSPTGRSLIGRGSHTKLSAQESFRFEYSLRMKLVDVTIN